MTFKTTKTILSTALVMVLLLPATAINVFAVTPVNISDTISDDKLMDRTADQWQGQYKNAEEFTIRQNAINEYVHANLQNNGWNQFMVKENIRIHNFDTMIGKIGYGYELVALSAAKEKILGTYDATGPVAKFHEWLLSKYAVPTSIEGIDARIATIVPDKYLDLVPQDVAAFNNIAAQGNVSPELHQKDPEYWTMVSNVAVCQYDKNCDHAGMEKILNNDLYRKQNAIIPALDVLDFFLPKASAITYVDDSAYLYANPNSCDYGICSSSTSYEATAPVDLSIYYNAGHAYGSLYVYASSCSTVSGASTEVSGTVDMGETFPIYDTGGSCAIDNSYYSIPSGGPYQWTVSTTNTAWTS